MVFGKKELATLVAEFLGTGVITLLFLSVLRSQLAIAFFIAATAGLALTLVTSIFGKVAGGYFNPAITIGLWTARKLSTVLAVLYVAVQVLGGWAAYYLFSYLSGATLPASKATFSGRTLVAEAVGAGILALAVASVAIYQNYSQSVVAAVTGLAYTIGIISGSSVVGISFLNPAVAIGAHTWLWSTYLIGPVIGGVIGVNLYGMLFANTKTATAKASVAAPAAKKKTSRKK